jgi:hypothetical protein
MRILDIPQSGKKGLDVSMNGRYGQVRRTLVIPTNPRTARRMTVRANLSAVAKRWRTLTENQRQAWNSSGNTYSFTARLGQSGPLTGLLTSLSTAKFGAPTPGTKIFVQASQMDSGFQNIPVDFSAIVPAS